MVPATVILDLDGTVWNSRPWYAEEIARLSGGSASEVVNKLEGGASVVLVAKEYGVSKARLIRAAMKNGHSVELYEGVIQTLGSLEQSGSLIGIVSNLPGWLAKPLLQSAGIERYITAIATPKMGMPAKPKPHGIRRVLLDMGRDVSPRTWFVGDGVADAKASVAAGVQFAWASYGYDTVAPSGTARVLERFDEVLGL